MIQSPDYHTDDSCQPEFSYPPIQVAEHRGAPLVSWSGLAIIRQLVERLGVAPAIDAAVRVLRRCKWYTESDHILTMIYNMLTGGSTLSDINRFRTIREQSGYWVPSGFRMRPRQVTFWRALVRIGMR